MTKGLVTYLAAPGSACGQTQSRHGLQSEEGHQAHAQQHLKPHGSVHGLQAFGSRHSPQGLINTVLDKPRLNIRHGRGK